MASLSRSSFAKTGRSCRSSSPAKCTTAPNCAYRISPRCCRSRTPPRRSRTSSLEQQLINLVSSEAEFFGEHLHGIVAPHAFGAQPIEFAYEIVVRDIALRLLSCGENDRDLPARFQLLDDLRNAAVRELLVQLGHLARDGDFDVAEDRQSVAEGVEGALRRLVHDRCVPDGGYAPIKLDALALAMRRESEECEWRRGDAARRESDDAGEWAGDRLDHDAAFARDAHEAKAGIGDHRHSGVAHERNDLAS